MILLIKKYCYQILDNGKIIESGSHQELLQLGKQYAHLWSRQAQGLDS